MGTEPQVVETELAESKENLKQDLKALEQELANRVRSLSPQRLLEQAIKNYPVESVAASTIVGLAIGTYLLDKKRRGGLDQTLSRLTDVALSALVQVATTKLIEMEKPVRSGNA